jgi:hypothetical protein
MRPPVLAHPRAGRRVASMGRLVAFVAVAAVFAAAIVPGSQAAYHMPAGNYGVCEPIAVAPGGSPPVGIQWGCVPDPLLTSAPESQPQSTDDNSTADEPQDG